MDWFNTVAACVLLLYCAKNAVSTKSYIPCKLFLSFDERCYVADCRCYYCKDCGAAVNGPMDYYG